VILDESSMLGAHLLDVYDKRFRALKDPSKPFGGVLLVLVADFWQLDPVKALPLYTPPGDPTLRGRALKGIETWNKIIDSAAVFTLRTAHRQKGDPEFKRLLLAFRDGPPTLEYSVRRT
jgi:hypothetical protein